MFRRRRGSTPLVVLLVAIALSGCRAADLKRDQQSIRNVVLDLYTDQVRDTLIRATGKMPFVHIDYTNFDGSAETFGKLTATDARERARSHFDLVPGEAELPDPTAAAISATRVLKSTFTGFGEASEKTSLRMTGNPVTASPEVYDAYLRFVADGFLQESVEAPCDAHIVRQAFGRHFYVRRDHAGKFLRLFLTTTVQRGGPPYSPFFENVILGLQAPPESPSPDDGPTTLYVKLKKPIPNASGSISFATKAGPIVNFVVRQIEGVERGKPTQFIRFDYRQMNADYPPIEKLKEDLRDLDVSILLDGFAPRQTTDEIIKQLEQLNREVRLQGR